MTWSRRDIVKLFSAVAAWPETKLLSGSSTGPVNRTPTGMASGGAIQAPAAQSVRGQDYAQLGYKIFILDFQFADLDPTTLKFADPEEYADAMGEMGVESLLIYANNVYGITFFKSQFTPKFKNISEDFFGEFLAACRQRKIRTIVYHSVYWQEHLAIAHPEWRLLDASGAPVRFQSVGVEGGVYFLCLNSPFRELDMQQVREIADRYTFDAWFVDEYFFHPSLACYNPSCLEQWKARTGRDLPRPLTDDDLPSYLDFMVDTYSSFYGQIKEQLQARGRRVLTTHNFGLDYRHDDFVIMEANPRGFDYYGLSVRTKLYRAKARGRELQMIPHRGNAYTDYTNAPVPHLKWQSATFVSHNSAVMWADQANVDGTLDPVLIRSLKKAYGVIDELVPKVRGTVPYAEVALVASERSYQLSRFRDYVDFYGANKLLTDLHWPFDVIAEEQLNLTHLARYRLVIVPGVQYLSAAQGQAILEYLEQGGTVFFCGHCSVRDEQGKPHARPHLGLVRLQETHEPRAYVRTAFPVDDERLKAANIATVEPDPGHQVLGTYIRPSVYSVAGNPFSDAPYPGEVTEQPVIVTGRKGRGSYAYVGYRFFEEYLKQNLPVFGQSLATITASFYQPEVWVEGPTVVEAVYNQLGNELRVFLINGITSRPSGGAIFQDPEQRGHINIIDVIPIADVRIVLRGKPVRRATDLAGRTLRVTRRAGHTEITLPRLEQYDVVSIEPT